MFRKDFIRVTQALRLTQASRETIIAVGMAISSDNPRFNLDKFVAECESPKVDFNMMKKAEV